MIYGDTTEFRDIHFHLTNIKIVGAIFGQNGFIHKKIPLTTKVFTFLCLILFALSLAAPLKFGTYSTCLSLQNLINSFSNNFYKILLCCFTHADIYHILYNLITFLDLAKLERLTFGTLKYFYLIILFGIVSNLISLIFYLVVQKNLCQLGFSGILFALIYIESDSSGREVFLFNAVKIPSKLYPWAMLILIHIFVQGSSLIGHLSGIISGILYIKGHLNHFILSNEKFSEIESSTFMNFMTTKNSYISIIKFGGSRRSYNAEEKSIDGLISKLKNLFNPQQRQQRQQQQQQQQQRQQQQSQNINNDICDEYDFSK
ncbi:hypothetical protein RB653_005915 [Dictyostelium firmibasis]|uniref:Peptidase S54 rhomboid domain-containing protein n=1 Tax=Dictyostelium firmibasis TaxID=79012 RepID=A0AAN7U8H4_9MYCE